MKFLLPFAIFLCHQTGIAQVLAILEDSIAVNLKSLQTATTNAQRDSASAHMRHFFIQAFGDPDVFEYPFSKLNMCTKTSADEKVRLINWNQPADDGSSRYYCFVLWKNEKTGELSWQELIDTQNHSDKLEEKYLNAEKWYGTLYYEIIPMSRKKKSDTYTLLGWESKDNLSTCKVMDALSIAGNNVRLGAPIFKGEKGKMRKRVIYEYNNEVSMSMKYHAKKKTIVVDHLSPENPMMDGVFSFYGPDGTYDAWQLEKGRWNFLSHIDVSPFSEKGDQPYNNPHE